jgi:hypothetical protein
MDLSCAKLGESQLSDSWEGMLVFPSGSVLVSGGFALVANQADTFQNRWEFLPDFEIQPSIPEVPDLEPYAGWGGSNLHLSNQGDEILLLDGWDAALGQVAYGSTIIFSQPNCSSDGFFNFISDGVPYRLSHSGSPAGLE